jgi:uncharacterized membrane protein YbhN (UPF0104 family)
MPALEMSAGEHPQRKEDDQGRRLRRGIVSLVVLMVLVAALLAAVPGLRDVADRLSDVDPWWIVLAAVLEVLSCAGYVLAFQHIFRRAQRRFAMRVALSEMAFGAVLPVGGAGGIAIGAWIVKAKGGPVRRFAERSAVLFLLTSGVNVATLVLAGLAVGLHIVPAPHPVLLGLVPAAVGIAVLAAFLALPRVASRLSDGESTRWRRWLGVTASVIEEAKTELRHPGWRLAGAIAYLWCDIAMLWVCFRALGHAPPVAALTLAFLIGYLGNVIPVPGGIGALDGGLAGALILYGAAPATAGAAVLAYHALVLWIPTLLGTLAFLRLRSTLDEPIALSPAPAQALLEPPEALHADVGGLRLADHLVEREPG